jgi:transcriptional regulator GlxA family with amidase domain
MVHQWQERQHPGRTCHAAGVQNVVALLAEPVAAFELGVIAEVFGLDRSGEGLPAVANAPARRMVMAAHRSGGQAQFVETPVAAAVPDDGVGDLVQWVRGHLDEPLSVEDLARRARMSPRTFARRIRASTGTTPHRWLLDQRLLLAEQLLEDTDLAVEQVARRCGLGSADTLRHHFTARRRVSPLTYRRTFRKSAGRPFAAPANCG